MLGSAFGAAFSAICFYALSRIIGTITVLIRTPISDVANIKNLGPFVLEKTLSIVAMMVPRLDMFGQSSWLVNGVKNKHDIWLVVMQITCYMPLLWLVTMKDVDKKEF
jgi:hypothetical protein